MVYFIMLWFKTDGLVRKNYSMASSAIKENFEVKFLCLIINLVLSLNPGSWLLQRSDPGS
jgi:hypothetical protein